MCGCEGCTAHDLPWAVRQRWHESLIVAYQRGVDAGFRGSARRRWWKRWSR